MVAIGRVLTRTFDPSERTETFQLLVIFLLTPGICRYRPREGNVNLQSQRRWLTTRF
jgi:hypothetical protein